MTCLGVTPVARRPHARRSERHDGRFTDIPAWIQAVTAVAAVVVAAIGVIYSMNRPPDKDPPIVERPEAFIAQVTIDADEVSANGEFRFVDLASEVILFVRKADDTRQPSWLPVEADASADPADTGERVNGTWDAKFPIEPGRFIWLALVVPAGSGVEDGYADVRERGPDSPLVLAASEEFRTGE